MDLFDLWELRKGREGVAILRGKNIKVPVTIGENISVSSRSLWAVKIGWSLKESFFLFNPYQRPLKVGGLKSLSKQLNGLPEELVLPHTTPTKALFGPHVYQGPAAI